jgi:hypothetical protein
MAKLNSGTRIYGNTAIDTFLTVSGGIASNSNTTGTLIVTGGVGITGNLYSGNVYITGTGNGITFADGTIQTTAGSSVANTVYLQGALNTANANTVYLQGALNTANANTVYLQAVNNAQNANITLVQSLANTDYTTLTAAAGTFGSSSLIPIITLAANGRVTGITTTSVSGGGGSSSGYLANAVIIANSTGYLSNTSNLLYFSSNNTVSITGNLTANYLITSGTGGTITGANIISANTFNAAISYIFADGTTQTTAGSSVANTVYLQTIINQANANIISVQALANTDYTTLSLSTTTSSSNGLYVPVISVAANGRITSITNTAITVSGGGSSSGYLANAFIIANSTGYLSNTSNLVYYSSNDVTVHTGTVITGRSLIASNSFIQSTYPVAAPTPIINRGSGSLSNTSTVAIGTTTRAIAFEPTGRFGYAASYGGNIITQLTINQANGNISNTSTISVGNGPTALAVDPTGRFVYVANYSGSSIGQYSINQTTGALNSIGSALSLFGNARFVTVDPTGRFVYATDFSPRVYSYTINQSTGALTSSNNFILAVGTDSLSVDPTGRFAYIAASSLGVVIYSINQVNGILTSLGTVSTPGDYPVRTKIDPSGRFLFTVHGQSVRSYYIDPNTGLISFISSSSINVFHNPYALGMDPSGKFLYVGTLFYTTQYTVNSLTGTLSNTATYSVENLPYNLEFEPTGRFLYANKPDSTPSNITQFNAQNFSTGRANVVSITFGDGTTQTTAASGGGSSSGYLANSFIIANSTGYLSNTSNLVYYSSNDVTKLSGTVIAGRGLVAANSFIQSTYPIVAPLPYTQGGSGLLSNTQTVITGDGTSNPTNQYGEPYSRATAIDPRGRYLYSLNINTNNVVQYSIDQSTGALSNVGVVVATAGATSPHSIVMHPSGRFIYVGMLNGNSSNYKRSLFSVDQANGALTLVTTYTTTTDNCSYVAIDPTGRFLYSGTSLATTPDTFFYSIDQTTGALTSLGSIRSSGNGLSDVAVDPTGRFVYVVSHYPFGVTSIYSINQTTGILTSVGSLGAMLNYTDAGPAQVAIHPSGKFFFHTGNGGYNYGGIGVYYIDPITGLLVPGPGEVGPGGFLGVYPLAVDPSGKYLYSTVTSTKSLYVYSINQYTGVLTPIVDTPGTIPVGTSPQKLTIDPTGRFMYLNTPGDGTITVFTLNNFSAGSANVAQLTVSSANVTKLTVANTLTVNSTIVFGDGTTQNTAPMATPNTGFYGIYDLDDISYLTDSYTSTFRPTYNTSNVTIVHPNQVSVWVDGVIQPVFIYNNDTVWLSQIYGTYKGYTIDYNGNIVFSDAPQTGAQVLIRTVTGTPTPTKKTYPFVPTDIIMGY